MNLFLSRWASAALLLVSALIMFGVASDAEARRFGGGLSFGRQSTNIMKQRQAVKPPAAQSAAQSGAGAAAAKGATAGAAKSGMSRWLGPIAGIAAGLGIAALLSSLGLSGALLEFLSSAILIALLIYAVMFIVRRLRPASPATSAMGAGNASSGNTYRQADSGSHVSVAASTASAPVLQAAAAGAHDPSWFIPADFDLPAFLTQAKQQYAQIQKLWDAGDRAGLSQLLTDDLLLEITPSLPQPGDGNQTDIVLLNAELMGIEQVAGGHLASVRYSGMLRETAGAQASHFNEVWNLYKADGAGWLLAGIQQIEEQ